MKNKNKCYWCKHRGDVCRTGLGNYHHCQNQEVQKEMEPYSPWGTWMMVFEKCERFEVR